MSAIDDLLAVMRALRDPETGCPWDLEQTFASIVPHTLEEAYEVADCIERNALGELPGELGDLLFQVVFYAQLASEQGDFDFDDIVIGITEKLRRRHPHVFATGTVADAEEQARHWEAHKTRERAGSGKYQGQLDGVPRVLPALTRAQKIQRRAASVGFDWPSIEGVKLKVYEEAGELEAAHSAADARGIEEEMGDLLFACVNWARHVGVDPEVALRAATHKFERRFGYIESVLADEGVALEKASLQRMDQLWEDAKSREISTNNK